MKQETNNIILVGFAEASITKEFTGASLKIFNCCLKKISLSKFSLCPLSVPNVK